MTTSSREDRRPDASHASLSREEVEIRTEDGVPLRATVMEREGTAPDRVVVFAHAMFARRGQFDRPSPDEGWLAAAARDGARAIAFDFRGHGDSGVPAKKGGFWSYDDLVQRDLPAVMGAARLRADGVPVVLVGHSLGGHAALAAIGAGKTAADGLALVASNVWMPRWDASLPRRLVKSAAIEAMRRATARVGYFPARALRQGSDDEAAPFVHDLVRFYHEDAWKSADGAIDYAASLRRVTIPVLAVVSERDRLECPPACAKAMLAEIGGPVELRVVAEGDGGGPAPSHMDLVIGARSRAVRDGVVKWTKRLQRPAGP